MGYGVAALQMLGKLVEDLPPNGAILELGQQNIEPNIPREAILACARRIWRDENAAQVVTGRYSAETRLPVSELFYVDGENGRRFAYRYRCLDLYPGDFTLVADLNAFSVPEQDRHTFDLITNIGTTEHITDQVNVFRVIHDYARVGASFIHVVPFTGYFNHGLFNYHPVFFVFLAAANEYEIASFNLSGPSLSYTIPEIAGVNASKDWGARVIDSGDIGCLLRKTHDRPFRLFTDFDQAVLGRRPLPAPWDDMVRKRHDLRVRT